MGRKRWIAGLTLWVGVIGWEQAAAQTLERFSLQVLLKNDAGVPAGVLEQAKRDAIRVFDRSNSNLEWIEDGPYQSGSLTLRIIAKAIGTKSRNRSVVGIAPGTREARGIIAYAFYERIQTYSAELALEISQMLGHVMAHELGHLLLPYDAHSFTGVMRGAWDLAQARQATAGLLTSTPEQAELIYGRLSPSSPRIARAR
jgi:hypothetical protein